MTMMLTSVALRLADGASAEAPTMLADTLQADGFEVSGAHLVFAGLYSILPP